MYVCALHVCFVPPQGLEDGVEYPDTGVKEIVSDHVDAGNRAQDHSKSRKHS